MADKAVINGHLEAGQNGHANGHDAAPTADGIARLAEEARRWEATTAQKSLNKLPERPGPFTTVSGQPINRLVELRVEIVNPELLVTFVSCKFSLSVLVRCDAGWHTPSCRMGDKKYKNI